MRKTLIGLASAAAVLAGLFVWRDPERGPLDATARAKAPGAFVPLSAGQVHYELSGPEGGRIAVLVHGFSVPSHIWDPTFRALREAGFRVLRFDLFGRGWSDRPDAAYDGPFYEAQIDELLRALRLEGPVDLIGVSFGGYLVARYAAGRPERIRTLTLVDPLTMSRPAPWYYELPAIGGLAYQMFKVPGLAEGQVGDFLQPERFPDWADRYRPQMRYDGFGRALHRTALGLRSVDFDGIYAAINRAPYPLLLVWGKQDTVLPIRGAERVRNAVSRTRFVAFDNAGHLPQLERPEIFEPLLLDFLRRSTAR